MQQFLIDRRYSPLPSTPIRFYRIRAVVTSLVNSALFGVMLGTAAFCLTMGYGLATELLNR